MSMGGELESVSRWRGWVILTGMVRSTIDVIWFCWYEGVTGVGGGAGASSCMGCSGEGVFSMRVGVVYGVLMKARRWGCMGEINKDLEI